MPHALIGGLFGVVIAFNIGFLVTSSTNVPVDDVFVLRFLMCLGAGFVVGAIVGFAVKHIE